MMMIKGSMKRQMEKKDCFENSKQELKTAAQTDYNKWSMMIYGMFS